MHSNFQTARENFERKQTKTVRVGSEQWRDLKQQSKYAYVRENATDDNSASGIQVWSRFTPITNEDCYQLGFVYGANNRPYAEGSKIAENARHIDGMRQFRHGYMNGRANHQPFK